MSSSVQYVFRDAPAPPAHSASSPSPGTLTSTSTTELTELPEELIDHICLNLGIKDIHNLRRTCKNLYLRSRRQFAIKHFQTLRLINTRDGLETGIMIAKNPLYGPVIKKIVISQVVFMDFAREKLNGDPKTEEERAKIEWFDSELRQHKRELDLASFPPLNCPENPQAIAKAEEALKQCEQDKVDFGKALRRQRRRNFGTYRNDQYHMRKKSIDIELLVELLKNLPALEGVALAITEFDEPNFPWGARKVEEKIGMLPYTGRGRVGTEYHREQTSYSTHAIGLVFGAIVRSGIKLKSLFGVQGALHHLEFPEHSGSRRLARKGTPAKTFNQQQMLELRPAFAELKELSLESYVFYNGQHPVPSLGWLRLLIPMWSTVEKLSIQGTKQYTDQMFLDNMVSSQQDAFPHLRHLTLQTLKFATNYLCCFIADHSKTLETLHVYYSSDYIPLLKELRRAPSFHLLLHSNSGPANRPTLRIRGDTPSDFQSSLDIVCSVIWDGHRNNIAKDAIQEQLRTGRIVCDGVFPARYYEQ